MGSGKYVTSYRSFTDDELEMSLRNRGVTGQFEDRHQMLAALHKADSTITFRFLDLPAEIRNIVYSELLTLREKLDSPKATHSCHPSILATCKRVKGEADGFLNDTKHAEISVRLYENPGAAVKPLWSDVHFQGVQIRDNRSITVQCPLLLRKIRSITLNLDVCTPKQQRTDSATRIWNDISRTLCSLYYCLSNGHRASVLKVNVSANVAVPGAHLHDFISPLLILSAKVERTEFNSDYFSRRMGDEMRVTINAYRRLFAVEHEVKLAKVVHDRVFKNILERLNAYQHNLYLQARQGRFARGKYRFDNGDEVNGIIPDIEAWIESAAAKATDSVPEDLRMPSSDWMNCGLRER